MADAIITLRIPEAKVQRVVNAMKKSRSIPVDEEGKPLFTDNQWAKERLRLFVVETVQRTETLTAKEAVAVNMDNDLVA